MVATQRNTGLAAKLPVHRRTQEQRSDQTRLAVQEATLQLLLDVGYTRLTTADTAKAARVSRGALTHHFSSKEDLVVRSIAFQLDRVTARLRDFAKADQAARLGVDEIVEHLWAIMSDGLFYITMEYLPEARHNLAFKERLIPVVQRFHDALDAVWAHIADTISLPPDRAKVMLNATMCLIRGMVAQSVLRNEPDYFSKILAYWKQHLRTELAEVAATQGPQMARGKLRPTQRVVRPDHHSN
jgi:AcrR family transcriptional regulator